MSCRVLVIPEDPTYNGYLLQPLVERLLAEAGRPHAQVLVLRNPAIRGFNHACDMIRDGSLRARYGYYDLWLFLPDGDQDKNLAGLEVAAEEHKARLIAIYLRPEVEATVIAGHPQADRGEWQSQREHPSFKESIFAPFLARHGNPTAPGQGRERLMREALAHYPRMKQFMPELDELEQRIRVLLNP